MILVDTAILVYAVGDQHPLRVPCVELMEKIGDGLVRATTTPEVIQEFVHVRSRRRSRPDAVGLAREYSLALGPLASMETAMVPAALDLFERHARLGAFDAFLAAVALANGAALVSPDAAFAGVDGLDWLDPGSAGFADAVGAR